MRHSMSVYNLTYAMMVLCVIDEQKVIINTETRKAIKGLLSSSRVTLV